MPDALTPTESALVRVSEEWGVGVAGPVAPVRGIPASAATVIAGVVLEAGRLMRPAMFAPKIPTRTSFSHRFEAGEARACRQYELADMSFPV